MSSVVIAGIWASGVYGISAVIWHKNLQDDMFFAVLLAVLAFFLSWIVLSFFISLLINVSWATGCSQPASQVAPKPFGPFLGSRSTPLGLLLLTNR
jgi:hypothetical protein